MTDPIRPPWRASSLVVPAGSFDQRIRSAVGTALAGIDEVHGIPKRVIVLLRQTRTARAAGGYDPGPPCITISRRAADPLGTIIHEFGHFLDNRILHPLAREYASRYDVDFDDLVAACLASPPVQAIERLLYDRRRILSQTDRVRLREASEPHELFARAYAQWVCTLSREPLLHESLDRRILAEYPVAGRACRLLWEHHDFADIMNAMNRLFRAKGLL